MRYCGSQHERCIRASRTLEGSGHLALLKDCEFALGETLANAERALADRDQCEYVTRGWLVSPAFTGFHRDQEIVDPRRYPDRAPHAKVCADNEAGWTDGGNLLAAEVLGFRLCVLHVRWKCHPQLEALDFGGRARGQFLPMPHAPSGKDRLHSTVADRSVPALRMIEGNIAFSDHRDRRDARMRMHRHAPGQLAHIRLEQIEKHEGFQ